MEVRRVQLGRVLKVFLLSKVSQWGALGGLRTSVPSDFHWVEPRPEVWRTLSPGHITGICTQPPALQPLLGGKGKRTEGTGKAREYLGMQMGVKATLSIFLAGRPPRRGGCGRVLSYTWTRRSETSTPGQALTPGQHPGRALPAPSPLSPYSHPLHCPGPSGKQTPIGLKP